MRLNCLTKWLVILVTFFSAGIVHAERTFLAFPQGFRWCAATAGHQIEGYNYNSDWWDWEQTPGHIRNGDKSEIACDHWNRLEEDTALMKDLNLKQYRFSIEWSKIEPSPGQWDWEAVRHYQREIELLRKNGIEPMLTLSHFVLPRWFAQKGAWGWEGAPDAFKRYADFVYRWIGMGVRDWVTHNEPTVALTAGYVAGVFPPGKNDMVSALEPMKGILKSHAAAYHTLHAAAKQYGHPIRVGIAHHLRIFDPDSIFNPLDAFAARTLDAIFNWLFGEAIQTGRFKLYIPLIISLDEEIENLEGTQDFIGVNYYSRDMVSFSLNGGPLGIELRVHEQSPTTDMGWEIYPEGFYRILKSVAKRFPGKPIVITENGIADSRDRQRKKFLETHLAALHQAMMEGVPVEGYCHWSLMDNFEWAEGYFPRFGLYEMDYATQKRTLRASGRFFSQIAKENGLWAERMKPSPWGRVPGNNY